MIESLETRTLFSSFPIAVRFGAVATSATLLQPLRPVSQPFADGSSAHLPAKYDGPELNAEGNDVAIEPIELPQDGSNDDPP